MKILHTADWHIGKSLYKHDLYEDILLFFEELVEIITQEKIDIVLISGDVFDLANPSNRDKEIYYQFLTSLLKMNVQLVITAGNHDSARMIEAPAQLLKNLNIHVVGQGINVDNQLIHLSVGQGPKFEDIVILAVPYLRDRDVRQSISGEDYDSKVKALREGIINHYKNLVSKAQDRFTNTPIIAMGHLYIQGASTSESERDIQMGNQAGISVQEFDMDYDYMALGHIHRPQRLDPTGKIQYSGSPIALSFSERKDDKQVIIIDIENDKIKSIDNIKLSQYRQLKRFSGTLERVKQEVFSFKNNAPLKALIELHIIEENHDREKIMELIAFASQESTEYKVANHKIQFENHQHELLNQRKNQWISELQPLDVFRSKLDENLQDESLKKDLEAAFIELMEDWQTKQTD